MRALHPQGCTVIAFAYSVMIIAYIEDIYGVVISQNAVSV
jgi:hypothetical protein